LGTDIPEVADKWAALLGGEKRSQDLNEGTKGKKKREVFEINLEIFTEGEKS